MFYLEELRLGIQKIFFIYYFLVRNFRIYEIVQRDTWVIFGDFIVFFISFVLFYNILFLIVFEEKGS